MTAIYKKTVGRTHEIYYHPFYSRVEGRRGSLNLPPGIDLREVQGLLRIVDPSTCGCARPDQHCEVPVPQVGAPTVVLLA